MRITRVSAAGAMNPDTTRVAVTDFFTKCGAPALPEYLNTCLIFT